MGQLKNKLCQIIYCTHSPSLQKNLGWVWCFVNNSAELNFGKTGGWNSWQRKQTICNNLNHYLTSLFERLGTDYKNWLQLQKRNEINIVFMLGGSFFFLEASTKNLICAGIDLLLGGILYFFTSQVPRCFCVPLILVIAESLSLIDIMEMKNNFYGFCKKQALCSDPENSAFLSSCSHRTNWKYGCEKLNRLKGKRHGRKECTAPVPTCVWVLRCLLPLLSIKGFTKLFSQNVFTNF